MQPPEAVHPIESDPVLQSVSALRRLLQALPLGRELTNGNLEKELKVILAAAIHSIPAEAEIRAAGSNLCTARYICVMDKEFNGVPVDLLAFSNRCRAGAQYAEPQFWMEMKCSLREAGDPGARDVAIRALSQIHQYQRKLHEPDWSEADRHPHLAPQIHQFRETLLSCPFYLVHLLSSAPRPEDGLPEWLMGKYPDNDPVSAEKLEAYYATTPELLEAAKGSLEQLSEEEARQRLKHRVALMEESAAVFKQSLEKLRQRWRQSVDPETTRERNLRQAIQRMERATEMQQQYEWSQTLTILDNPILQAVVVKFRCQPRRP